MFGFIITLFFLTDLLQSLRKHYSHGNTRCDGIRSDDENQNNDKPQKTKQEKFTKQPFLLSTEAHEEDVTVK